VLLGVGAVLAVLLLIALVARNTGQDATTAPPSHTPPSHTPASRTPSSAPPSSAPATSSAPSSAAPSSPSSSASPETVTIDRNDYIGRDVPDVEKELKDLGLKVDRNQLDNPGTAQENAVQSVDPDGRLDKGATVTVSYYGAPPLPASPTTSAPGQSGESQGSGNSHGKGKAKG
jgi:serine/threonine-protein kinase